MEDEAENPSLLKAALGEARVWLSSLQSPIAAGLALAGRAEAPAVQRAAWLNGTSLSGSKQSTAPQHLPRLFLLQPNLPCTDGRKGLHKAAQKEPPQVISIYSKTV